MWTSPPTRLASDPLAICYLGNPNSIHLRRWAGYFAAHGHRVTLLVPSTLELDPGLPPEIAIERFTPYWTARFLPLGAWRCRQSLRAAVARRAPDVLHAHYLTRWGWLARLSGFRPYAITVWGSDVLITARKSLRTRLYARLALARASLVTADSEALVEATVVAGARRERTLEVQFGVDRTEFSPGNDPALLRQQLGLEHRRVIFAPRTIAPLYRHETLLQAVAGLDSDVVVVMTRHVADPAALGHLERLAERLQLSDRLRILPTASRAEMVQLYRLADVVVTIPAQDGTPVTLLEALSVGRPVVASNIPANREWLGEVDPSALVPVDDVEATRRAIELVLGRDQADATRIAEQGRALVRRRADHYRSMAEVESFYRVLRDRPS